MRPFILNALYEGIEDCSIWSVDLYFEEGKQKYLAVGSNSKIISIWNISNLLLDSENIPTDSISPIENQYRMVEDDSY